MAYQKVDQITLKWGTLKHWDLKSETCKQLLKEYLAAGASASAMMQHDTPEQKEIICKMIDAATCKRIFLDWDGKWVSKKEAKKYVLQYDQP